MAIFVDSILFNIDPVVGAGAINIRIDPFHSVSLPEWTRRSKTSHDAPAAYTIDQLDRKNLVIQVALRPDAGEEIVWIKAQDIAKDGPNLLGSIPEFRVEFRGPEVRHITIPITPNLSSLGFHDDVWQWEYRTRGGGGIAAISRHRIYSLLSLPNSPWDAKSGNSYVWPWQRILDLACEWGSGATTLTEAAKKIGEKIYSLGKCVDGKRLLRYDIRDTTSTFADTSFDGVEFLRTVGSQPLTIHKGCCSDFAGMLITVANAAGCNLTDVTLRMANGEKFFTNPVKAIGRPDFEDPFEFRFHEIAFEGKPGPGGYAWDCCFQEDGDDNPSRSRRHPIPAFHMPFGEPGSLGYLDRLVQPHFQAQIVPRVEQPNYGVTPLVEAADEVPGASSQDSAIKTEEPTEKIFVSGLFLSGIEFDQWMLCRIMFPRLADGDTEIDSFLQNKENPDVLARLRIEIEDTIRDAQDKAVRRVLRSAGMPHEPGKPVKLPAKNPGEVVILTAIGNLSITCQNIGFEDRSLFRLHEELEDLFATKPPGEVEPIVIDSSFRTDFKIDFKTRDGSAWFKLFTSPEGNLFSLGKDVYFTPGAGHKHRVDVYEMSGMLPVDHYAYEFRVPPKPA